MYAALLLAERAHRGQTRRHSGDPYIVHPIRVAARAEHFGLGEHAQAAALLHDVAEDTAVTLDDLRAHPDLTQRTVALVTLLTKWWEPDEAVEKPEYYRRILEDLTATALKVLDRADNLDDMVRLWQSPTLTNGQRRWSQRYLDKTDVEFRPLLDRLEQTRAAGARPWPDYSAVVDTFARSRAALAFYTKSERV